MLLQDKDRIFQNLYGMADRSLKGAMARGCWDNTAEIISRGRDKIIDQMKASGRAAGATGWLVKPFDPQKLLDVVRRLAG